MVVSIDESEPQVCDAASPDAAEPRRRRTWFRPVSLKLEFTHLTSLPFSLLRRVRPRRASALVRLVTLQQQAARGRDKASSSKDICPWVNRAQADFLFAFVIVCYAAFVGVEVSLAGQASEDPVTSRVMLYFEIIFTALFTVDYLRNVYKGCWGYICGPSGILDGLLMATSIASCLQHFQGTHALVTELRVVRVARLLRLCQITRVLRTFPELWLVFQGLKETVLSVSFAGVPLLLLLYTGSLVCADILGLSAKCTSDGTICVQEFFGSVPLSLLTQVKLALVEAWPDIAEVMLLQSRWWSGYLVFIIVLSNMVILNVIAYVVCGHLQVIIGRDQLPSLEQQQQSTARQMDKLEQLFDAACSGQDYLEEAEYLSLLTSRKIQPLLKDMDIGLPDFAEEALILLDPNDVGYLSRDDWVSGMLRLRGTRKDHASKSLHLDLLASDRDTMLGAEDSGHRLKTGMKESITQTGWSILHQIKALEEELEDLWHESLPGDHEVAIEEQLPDLEDSPCDIHSAMQSPVPRKSASSSGSSTPTGVARELFSPPLEESALVKPGLSAPKEELSSASADLEAACALLETELRSWQDHHSQNQRACEEHPVPVAPLLEREVERVDNATQTEELQPEPGEVAPPVNPEDPACAAGTPAKVGEAEAAGLGVGIGSGKGGESPEAEKGGSSTPSPKCGWASDPAAAQRRAELLASLHRQPRPVPLVSMVRPKPLRISDIPPPPLPSSPPAAVPAAPTAAPRQRPGTEGEPLAMARRLREQLGGDRAVVASL